MEKQYETRRGIWKNNAKRGAMKTILLGLADENYHAQILPGLAYKRYHVQIWPGLAYNRGSIRKLLLFYKEVVVL